MKVAWAAAVSGKTLKECEEAALVAFGKFLNEETTNTVSLSIDVASLTANGIIIGYTGMAYAEFVTRPANQ